MTDKSAIMKKLDAHHLLLDGSARSGRGMVLPLITGAVCLRGTAERNAGNPDDGISGAGCLLAA